MTFDYASATVDTVEAEAARAIADAEALVAAVRATAAAPTYAETLEPLDVARGVIADAIGAAGFMGYVHPDAGVRAAGHAASAQLERWIVDLPFDPDVAAAVTAFAATDEAVALTGERARLLAFTRRDLRRAGHELDDDARAEVRAAMARLVEIGVRFNRNIAEVDDVLIVTDDELDGMPRDYRDGLGRTDDGRYRVTMAYPDVIPFMENARRRDRREALNRLFNSRAVASNRELLAAAVHLRERVAELFGEPSWAHHTMGEKMAGDPKAVDAFFAELVPPLTDKAKAEIDRMAALLAAATGDASLEVWDWRFYDTELRRSEYGVDMHEVAAYFPLEQVLGGLLAITSEAFGLRYERLHDQRVWHEDVRSFAIVDAASGERIAVTHMDLHPREGKFSHAAAFDIVPGRRLPDGTYRTPVACIVANVTKPSADRPSLLTHDEVLTLFHEFGHILHQTLTRAETARFSGTNTELDFVEAPSQIMEHWCWRPEVLVRFARHHRTGEVIPEQLVHQLVALRTLNVGVDKLRQVQFGVLDMGLHGPRRRGRGHRRRARPRRHPAARRGGVRVPAPGRHVLPGQLRPPARRLRCRLLRLPVVGGVRRRHVQPLRRRRRDQPGGRRRVPPPRPRARRIRRRHRAARTLPRPRQQLRLPRQARHHLVHRLSFLTILSAIRDAEPSREPRWEH